jgi:branched-chain amino acid transport system substrate-binding protein
MKDPRKLLLTVTAALLAALALVAASCGDDEESSGGDSGGGDSASAPSGPAIHVGSIASCSGAQAPSLGGTCDVLEAWEKQTNEQGGINGHPVKLTVIDDGGVPARGQAAAKRLVEGEKVMAIVGEYSLSDPTWAEYVDKKGVPVVGGAASESPFLTDANFYPSGAQVPTLLYGLVNETKRKGKTKLGVLYCAEAPVCAGLPPVAEKLAKDVVGGLEVVYKNKVAAAAPNYTAVCRAAQDKGVEALYTAANTETTQRVRDQCAQQGFKPLLLGTVGTVDSPQNPNFEGALSALSNAPVADTTTPAGKDFNAAVDEHASSLRERESQFNNTLTAPWAGGELFRAAAEAGDIGPDSTPADVKRGLYALKDNNLRGMSMPLTFTKGKPTFVRCYFVQEIKDGKLTSTYGAEPQCLEEAKVPELMKALGG